MMEWIDHMRFVFWGVTWPELFLAAGRYLLMISAALLVLKHVTFSIRDRGKSSWRAILETSVGLVVAIVYAQKLYFDGRILQLDQWESAVQVWAFALLFIGLVILREKPRRSQ